MKPNLIVWKDLTRPCHIQALSIYPTRDAAILAMRRHITAKSFEFKSDKVFRQVEYMLDGRSALMHAWEECVVIGSVKIPYALWDIVEMPELPDAAPMDGGMLSGGVPPPTLRAPASRKDSSGDASGDARKDVGGDVGGDARRDASGNVRGDASGDTKVDAIEMKSAPAILRWGSTLKMDTKINRAVDKISTALHDYKADPTQDILSIVRSILVHPTEGVGADVEKIDRLFDTLQSVRQ